MGLSKLGQAASLMREWVSEEAESGRDLVQIQRDLLRVFDSVIFDVRIALDIPGVRYYQLHDRILTHAAGQLMDSALYAKLLRPISREEFLELTKDRDL